MVFYIGTFSFALFLMLMAWPLGLLFLVVAIIIAVLRSYGRRIERAERARGAGLESYMGGRK